MPKRLAALLVARSIRRRSAGAAGALLAAALLVLPATEARAVDIQEVVSDSGVRAWLVEDDANPVISMQFAFRGGAAADPEGQGGLANFVSGLLDEGAGDLDSQAFQRRLAEEAISLSFSAGRDSFSGSLRTLSERRSSAFELLNLALTQPRFDEEPVERIRAQILAGIERTENTPSALGFQRLMANLYPDHPYGRPVEGERESVSAIGAEDLQRFVETRFGRDRLFIGVVGDIEAAELERLLDVAFADLPAAAQAPEVAPVAPKTGGAVTVIDRAVPQSQVAFAQQGLKRDDPDYYAATLVNYILGGGSFASRLYEEVREERGLVYSISTSLYPFDRSALLVGGFGTQNARVGEALDVVRNEWRRMDSEGLDAEDLERAKTYILGSFPLNLTSTGGIASVLLSMQLDGLGIDYLDEREALFNAVTVEDARRVAAELLTPEALSVVVVGQPEGVEDTADGSESSAADEDGAPAGAAGASGE